jgi:lysophospholipase L1-like esterase
VNPRPRLTWKHRLLLVAFGFGLAGLLELGLRLAGFGGGAPLLHPLGPAGPSGQLYEIHPRAAEIFFARSGPGGAALLGSHRRDLVVLPKPANTVRVVFLGASTVEGFPMPRNLTGARFLQAMLQSVLPDRRVEVINLGVTAVASFPIRKLAVEVLDALEPDLLLVYEAHNEFFGASGVASFQSMGRGAAAMEAVYLLRHLALVQAAEALRGRLQPRTPGGRPDLIQIMAAVQEIPPGSELHAAARQSLEENFRAIVRAARQHGVPVVLATVASNERDLAPIASSEEDLPPGRRKDWERRLAAADPYGYARALEAAGRPADAAEQYRRARDLDAMPWRASRDKNAVLRRLAAEERVPLADCEATFAAESRSPAGDATTWELFMDHVHPSLRGQALLARTFLATIARSRLLPVAPDRLAALPDWRETAARLGAHPLELFLLAHKMAALFKVPPIGSHNAAAARRFDALVRRLRESADPVDAEAIRVWEKASGEVGFALPISYFGGVAALRSGQHPRAAVYLRAAAENAFPLSDERCAAALLAVINALQDGGDPAGARRQLAASLAEARRVEALPDQPTALLARTLADLLTLSGDAGPAGPYEAIVREKSAAAPPWERVFLRELPEPRALGSLIPADLPPNAPGAAPES